MDFNLVIKRNGRRQAYDREKLERRIRQVLQQNQILFIDVHKILDDVEKVFSDATDACTIDDVLTDVMAKHAGRHPVYDTVAAQILLDCIYRDTPDSFSEACNMLAAAPNPILTPEFMADLATHQGYFDIMVGGAATPGYTYTGLLNLKKDVLLHRNGKLIERPQYAFMRLAISLYGRDPVKVINTFESLISQYYVHSPATMARAGTTEGHLLSAHVLHLAAPNSARDVVTALNQTAALGASGCSTSIDCNNVPSAGTRINGVPALGLQPVLSLYDAAAAMHAGTQHSIPVSAYIQAHHGDIVSILTKLEDDIVPTHLKFGLCLPSIFMFRAQNNLPWSLFSPSDVPLLANSYGVAFDAAYFAYEMDPRVPRTCIPARTLFSAICRCQLKVGQPIIVYKDHMNAKSNQSNLGITSQGDAFGATMQYSMPSETGTTSEAALILPSFVRSGEFDFDLLFRTSQSLTVNLNKVIDGCTPASKEAVAGTRRQRAIAVGVQGLADLLLDLRVPYASIQAKDIVTRVFQTIYYASVSASVQYARENGAYRHFGGSPLSRGLFMFDLWHQTQDDRFFDWAKLRSDVAMYGTSNSVFTALMPMDAMVDIAGCQSSFGPIKSVISNTGRNGEHAMIHPSLVMWLSTLGLWNDNLRKKILRGKGKISHIEEIPSNIRQVFLNSWELGPEAVVDMAIVVAPFICQGQSLDLQLESPTLDRVMNLHYKSWGAGLKSGLYSLSTRTEHDSYVKPSRASSDGNVLDNDTTICSTIPITVPSLTQGLTTSDEKSTRLVIRVPPLAHLLKPNDDDIPDIDYHSLFTSDGEDECIHGAFCTCDNDADGEPDPEYSPEEVDQLMYDDEYLHETHIDENGMVVFGKYLKYPSPA